MLWKKERRESLMEISRMPSCCLRLQFSKNPIMRRWELEPLVETRSTQARYNFNQGNLFFFILLNVQSIGWKKKDCLDWSYIELVLNLIYIYIYIIRFHIFKSVHFSFLCLGSLAAFFMVTFHLAVHQWHDLCRPFCSWIAANGEEKRWLKRERKMIQKKKICCLYFLGPKKNNVEKISLRYKRLQIFKISNWSTYCWSQILLLP